MRVKMKTGYFLLHSYLFLLTCVTIRSSETKVTHADASIPQRFAVTLTIAVWTRVIKTASQLCVHLFQRVKQIVHHTIVIYLSNAPFKPAEVDFWVVE